MRFSFTSINYSLCTETISMINAVSSVLETVAVSPQLIYSDHQVVIQVYFGVKSINCLFVSVCKDRNCEEL